MGVDGLLEEHLFQLVCVRIDNLRAVIFFSILNNFKLHVGKLDGIARPEEMGSA